MRTPSTDSAMQLCAPTASRDLPFAGLLLVLRFSATSGPPYPRPLCYSVVYLSRPVQTRYAGPQGPSMLFSSGFLFTPDMLLHIYFTFLLPLVSTQLLLPMRLRTSRSLRYLDFLFAMRSVAMPSVQPARPSSERHLFLVRSLLSKTLLRDTSTFAASFLQSAHMAPLPQ